MAIQNSGGTGGEVTIETVAGSTLGMFEVFGRRGPQNLGVEAVFDPKIPYKLTCQFQQL